MHDEPTRQRLRTAMEHAAPDALDQILASCGTRQGSVCAIPPQKKRNPRRAPLAAAAALFVMCCCAIGLTSWRSANMVASVVSLDVNPSIQLQVNQKERVLSAQALNEDASVILAGMDLKNTQLNVAVNAIVGSLLQHGYLDRISSAILISVEDDDTQRASRLESTLTAEVDAALQNAAAGAAVLSQIVTYDAGLESQAQASSISVGKAALIRRVQSLNGSLHFNTLASLSVEELDQLQKTGAPGMPIGKAAAAAAAESYAGLTAVDAVTWDVDAELDEAPAHYEVELETAFGAFTYDVDAYTGQVLRGTADVMKRLSPDAPSAISDLISESKARSIALNDAGIASSSALGLQSRLDWDDGIPCYEVEFRAGALEYEYEIHAQTGAVLQAERDGDDDWRPASSGTALPAGSSAAASAPAGSEDASGSTGDTAFIGAAAAGNAALSHAGLSASDVSDLKCTLEEHEGLYHYEVEFECGNTEYDYEIDAATGAVLQAEAEPDD